MDAELAILPQVEGKKETGGLPDPATPTQAQRLRVPEVLQGQRKPCEYMSWDGLALF